MRADLQETLSALHEHLEATAELPVRPDANRWLGEAEAVAADLAADGAAPSTVRERVGHVRTLLESAGETGSAEAGARVEAALDCVDEVERLLGDRA